MSDNINLNRSRVGSFGAMMNAFFQEEKKREEEEQAKKTEEKPADDKKPEDKPSTPGFNF